MIVETRASSPERAGTIRMRRWRDRRRRGFRCITIEVSDADVDALVAGDLLDRTDRSNDTAVDAAIGRLLDSLGR